VRPADLLGGEPFLPELLISRELLRLACVPGLKQIGHDRAEHDPDYCGKACNDAVHPISRPYRQREFTRDHRAVLRNPGSAALGRNDGSMNRAL
jgi:hypothetical protein